MPPVRPTEVLFQPFPKQEEAVNAAFSGKYSFILYGGAIRGGKTFWLLGTILVLARIYPGSRWAIVRKNLPTIKKNLLPSWDKIKPTNFIRSYKQDIQTVTLRNGSQIVFFPENYNQDKELNRFKGLEVNGFGFEEINECQRVTLGKAFERAGTYIIPKLKVQPKPIILATCNPTQGWVKKDVHDPWKNALLQSDWLYIQSRVYDNLPLLEAQPDLLPNWKKNLTRYEYQVFVEGDWDVQLKTGGEFLRNFEIEQHVRPVDFDPNHRLSVSMDANAYPWITFTLWQFIPDGAGFIIRQVGECTPEDPRNTAGLAGDDLVAELLDEYEYKGTINLFGDRSLKNRNVTNENRWTFFQTVDNKLREGGFPTIDRFWNAPPAVHLMGDFCNAAFRGEVPGLRIEIGEHCKRSINDYIGAKTDNDGGILKRMIPHPTIPDLKYQEFGHHCDTLKDMLCQAFPDEFTNYTRRHQKMQIGGIEVIQRGDRITF